MAGKRVSSPRTQYAGVGGTLLASSPGDSGAWRPAMGRFRGVRSIFGVAALFALASGAASAKDAPKADPKSDPKADAKAKEAYAGPRLRWAHSYADALAEARDRGCVVFATFHGDG